MRWKRKRQTLNDGRPSEATRARQKAEADLAATRAKTAKYRDLAESLRQIREENNFAAAIVSSFQGGNRK